MRFFLAVSLVSMVATVAITGCGSAADSTPAGTDVGDATASALAGTYNISGKNETPFNQLTINTDHTYQGTGGCLQTGSGPHCNAISYFSGKWSNHKSGPELGAPGGAQGIIFDDDVSGKKTSYFYTLVGKDLKLSTVFDGTPALFVKEAQLKKLKMNEECANSKGETLGECPEEFPCEYNGPHGKAQYCLPPI